MGKKGEHNERRFFVAAYCSSAVPRSRRLLRGAFRPTEQVCVLRCLWRQRGMLLKSQARDVLHMQKALTQMNVQLTNVISVEYFHVVFTMPQEIAAIAFQNKAVVYDILFRATSETPRSSRAKA